MNSRTITTECCSSTTMALSSQELRESAYTHAYSLARFNGATPEEALEQAEAAARRHETLHHARAL